jgi:hypothetical protein
MNLIHALPWRMLAGSKGYRTAQQSQNKTALQLRALLISRASSALCGRALMS